MSTPQKQRPHDHALNVSCPHCGAGVGTPTRVSTRKGNTGLVDVTLRCPECDCWWIVQKLTHDEPPA